MRILVQCLECDKTNHASISGHKRRRTSGDHPGRYAPFRQGQTAEEVKQQIHSETGLGETLEGLRDDLKKAGESAREDLREVADQVRKTAEEVRIDPPREQATGEESPSAESPRPDTKP